MKSSSRFEVIFLVLAILILLLSAGCTSGDHREKGSLQGVSESLPATRPPQPGIQETNPPTLYQDIDDIKDALYSVSMEWESNGLTCNSNSCTGNFIDTAGNTVTIRATLYSSVDAAHTAYEAEKQKGSNFRQVISPQAGDESYAWQHLTTAELGVRKSNLVAVFDYGAAAGAATVNQVREIATMAMAGL